MLYLLKLMLIGLLEFATYISILLIFIWLIITAYRFILAWFFPKKFVKLHLHRFGKRNTPINNLVKTIAYQQILKRKIDIDFYDKEEIFEQQIIKAYEKKYSNLIGIRRVYASDFRSFFVMAVVVTREFLLEKEPPNEERVEKIQKFVRDHMYNVHTELVAAQYLIGVSKAGAILRQSNNKEVKKAAQQIFVNFERDFAKVMYHLFLEQEKINKEANDKTVERQLEEIQLEKDFIDKLKKRTNF